MVIEIKTRNNQMNKKTMDGNNESINVVTAKREKKPQRWRNHLVTICRKIDFDTRAKGMW
jgi:hypothetical protein